MTGRRLAPQRQVPSQTRRPDGPVRSFGLDVGPLALVPPQPAGWAHLITVRSGAIAVHGSGIFAIVTSRTALWVPAGVRYALDLRVRCALRIAYVDAALAPELPACSVVPSALLCELVERAVASGYLDPAVPEAARLLAVFADELARLRPSGAAYALPLPHDAKLRAAAERACTELDGCSVRELAASADMPLRTFQRRFARDTGLAPRVWLQRARLGAAALALEAGDGVTETALACGYASLSAFIAAYRRAFGTTPGRRRTAGGGRRT